jgi:hypothetical protein
MIVSVFAEILFISIITRDDCVGIHLVPLYVLGVGAYAGIRRMLTCQFLKWRIPAGAGAYAQLYFYRRKGTYTHLYFLAINHCI